MAFFALRGVDPNIFINMGERELRFYRATMLLEMERESERALI